MLLLGALQLTHVASRFLGRTELRALAGSLNLMLRSKNTHIADGVEASATCTTSNLMEFTC